MGQKRPFLQASAVLSLGLMMVKLLVHAHRHAHRHMPMHMCHFNENPPMRILKKPSLATQTVRSSRGGNLWNKIKLSLILQKKIRLCHDDRFIKSNARLVFSNFDSCKLIMIHFPTITEAE